MNFVGKISAAALLASLFLSGAVTAKDAKTGITPEVLRDLEKSLELDADTRAFMNAVTNNDINDLAFDREFFAEHDHLFNFKVKTKGVTNQKSSGRCWLFAGYNVMRPSVMEKYDLAEFEFSENYLFFWDKLEKANMFLEVVIETRERDIDDRELQTLLANPVPDGGWWSYVVNLIEKYGTVPKSVMPETKNTSNTRRMNSRIAWMARSFAADLREASSKGADEEELRAMKMRMLEDVYRVLVLSMGVPPKEFTWRVENNSGEIFENEYTPLSFYREAVELDLSEYICIFNHPAHEYGKLYQIHYCRNMPDAPDITFINLEIDKLKDYTLRSVLNNEPVWFGADVGHGHDVDNGILSSDVYDYESIFGDMGEMTKEERVLYRESAPGHAMVITGVDLRDDTPRKWLVENSWGTERGNKGYWAMYDEWFDRYVFSIIVNKRHVPEGVKAILETEPEVLPAWEPLRNIFD